MKTFTYQELIDFVKKQPDDRPIDFMENFSYENCGCLLVHFAKEQLGIKETFGCGFTNVEMSPSNVSACPVEDDRQSVFNLTNKGLNNRKNLKNYGQLKLFIDNLSKHN